MNLLDIEKLSVGINGKEILKEIDFSMKNGEVVVVMGPNGAGKSTVSNAIMANPLYNVNGKIKFEGKDISKLSADERAKKGIFMSFQHPVEIDGVTLMNFLRTSYNNVKGTKLQVGDFIKILNEQMDSLNMDQKFRGRFVNTGFSGGEKKRAEILQVLLLEPKLAILDEIDSGLDVDAMKLVSGAVNNLIKKNKMGVLMITHQTKFLEYFKIDKVVVLKNGQVEVHDNVDKIKKKIEKDGFK